MKKIIFSLILMASIHPVYAQDHEAGFKKFVEEFKGTARLQGVSEATLTDALADARYLPRVIELDQKQPESKVTFADYKNRVVSAQRINQGRYEFQKNRALLEEVGKAYGVQPQYIVALWGIETNFGTNTGGFDVVDSLATLAYEGRRKEFFSDELMNALKIIDADHISAADMRGSWAGAMGQSQFMPSSFLKFAQDYNKDGRRDIWNTKADVFASAANYLAQSGWKGDEKWGRLVQLPSSLPDTAIERSNKKDIGEWASLGVTLPNGQSLPVVAGMKAGLVAPDGKNGSTYMTYDNYDVIMTWNRSTYFATSVGLLADAIAAGQ